MHGGPGAAFVWEGTASGGRVYALVFEMHTHQSLACARQARRNHHRKSSYEQQQHQLNHHHHNHQQPATRHGVGVTDWPNFELLRVCVCVRVQILFSVLSQQ